MTVHAPEVVESAPAVPPEIAELELALLVDGVRQLTGYDLRDSAPALLRRRITERVRAENLSTVAGLLERVLHDPSALSHLLDAVTLRPSELFADVGLFAALRGYVVRWLRTFPTVRVWVVGGAEDAYAVAIAFLEADLLGRTRIYATFSTQAGVERAAAGSVEISAIGDAERRYREGGGRYALDLYLQRDDDAATFIPAVREQIIFSKHHLPTDGSFNEFHLVLAPNVDAVYAPAAAYRAHRTIYQSLARFGLLYAGSTVGLASTPHAHAYEPVPGCDGLLRRIR
jgi:chemotaxis protein methyltransferase CheR